MSKRYCLILFTLVGLCLAWDDVSDPYPYDDTTANPCLDKEEGSCKSTNAGTTDECCFLQGFWKKNMTHDSDCYLNKGKEGPEKIKAFWDDVNYTTVSFDCPSYGNNIFFLSWHDVYNPYPEEDDPCLEFEFDKDGCLAESVSEGECTFLEGVWKNGTKDSDCFWNKYGESSSVIKAFWDVEDYHVTNVIFKTERKDPISEEDEATKNFELPFSSWSDAKNPYPDNTPCDDYELDKDGCLSITKCVFLDMKNNENGEESTDCFYNLYDNTPNEIKGFWDDDEWTTTGVLLKTDGEKIVFPYFTSWSDTKNPYPETTPCDDYELNKEGCLSTPKCVFLDMKKNKDGEESTDCFYNLYDNTPNEIKGFWDDNEWTTVGILMKKGGEETEYPFDGSDDDDDDGLKGGAVAGIAIATFVVGLLIGILVIYLCCVKTSSAGNQYDNDQVITTSKP